MSALEAGSAVRLALTVRSGNDRVDPDDVTLDVRAPGGTVTSYAWQGAGTVQRDGVGQFSRLVELPEAGTWRFTWATTGAYQVVRSGTLYVEAPAVEPGSGAPPA